MLAKRVEYDLNASIAFENMSQALPYLYHKTDNPGGVISLGIDENTLMSEELSDILSTHMKINPDIFTHGSSGPALTARLLKLYNKNPFNSIVPVEKEHLYFTAGFSTLIERLLWTLCEEGEGVLTGRSSCIPGISERSKVIPIYVSLDDIDPFSSDAVGRFEKRVKQAHRSRWNVRMLIFSQPCNLYGKYIALWVNLMVDAIPVMPSSNTSVSARNITFILFLSKLTH